MRKKAISTHAINIGSTRFVVMAGPCSVESEGQILAAAKAVKRSGAAVLRGGAFKPRTSPHSFQGLGRKGLELLQKAKKATGLPIITEVMDTREVELVDAYADIVQIGARNMQNFSLLKAVGALKKPVLLKRGLSATISEWLYAAEYIFKEGNKNVIFCERGIRTFETATRNTLDLAAVPILKRETGLPVIVDPSHGTGRRDLIIPLSKAAIAVGADGLLIEVHPHPEKALSDGAQSLNFKEFSQLMAEIKPICKAAGRAL